MKKKITHTIAVPRESVVQAVLNQLYSDLHGAENQACPPIDPAQVVWQFTPNDGAVVEWATLED